MLDLARDLNERQLEAVRHVDGPLLVIAGAGSGKTRVITYRVANLVFNHGVRPRRVMAVTFTNKAASEMRERIERLIGRDAALWVMTFHSSCARLLRRYGDRTGVDPRFTIYDDQDQKAMVARVIKELGFDDRRFPPRAIKSEINRAKRELVGPAEYPASDFYRERVQRIYELYDKRMHDSSALDFGDLLYRIVRGMQQDESLRREITGLFDHVLVDEFQDTNHVQLELVRLLGAPHRNVCVVGDDDQSIYSWRGADVTNILGFETHFPGARVVTLDRNYRSDGNILAAAHGVVDRLAGRRPKELWTSNPAGERVGLVEAPDEREEARLVAQAVREVLADGHPLAEQAVFYRTNAQSRVFEEVFRSLDIPHRVVGGMRFYERAEVKDVIAYLRLVQNPGDLAAFLRVVNTPARGIGKTTLDRLVGIAAGAGISAYEAIDRAVDGGVGKAPAAKLAGFKQLVEAWRTEIGEGPSHLARRVLDDTGYAARLEQEDTAEADARLENVRELLGSIDDFEAEAEEPSLDSFLELIALQTDVDEARFDGEEVTLMTAHSAKGLEFDVVYVTGLEDGLFPYRAADEGLFGTAEEELAEERRLCYVAMTRARKRLLLTRAAVRRLFGTTRVDPPSRFLADVPPELLIDLTPARREEVWVDRSFDQTIEAAGFQPGQAVRHARFGAGTVVAVHAGARPKVEVRFPAFGTKTIVADYLEPG